jgi:kynureninase
MAPDFSASIDRAFELDSQDELASFRRRFAIPEPDLIYLDGNSLGRLPKETVARLEQLLEEQWGRRLIRGWDEGWYNLPERVGGKMAGLLGARPNEVIMADATSINLFKLALASLALRPGRTKIVTDNLNFPTDLYILDAVCRLAGPEYELLVVESADEIHGPIEGLNEAIDQQTALLSLSHTTFKSSYTYDPAAVTEIAHRAGALALLDCSHSVGAMPIELNRAGVDLAIGCSYKYVNGGPGGPAFLYIRHDLQDQMANPISGWMGHKNPFNFELNYEPTGGLRRFLSGTPPILALAAVEVGIDLLLEAGLERIRSKSLRQSEYLIELGDQLLAPHGYRLKSPRLAAHRGSHVTLGHDQAARIGRVLIEQMNVLPDFRPPDNIRLGIAPLYNSFVDIYNAISRLHAVVEERLYEQYPQEDQLVNKARS